MRIVLFFLALGLLALAGCSGGSSDAPDAAGPPAGNDDRTAGTLPIPGQTSQMPPGHPPMGATGQVVWNVPAAWSEQPPASSMRIAQYAVAGPAGLHSAWIDTAGFKEFTVYYASTAPEARRWHWNGPTAWHPTASRTSISSRATEPAPRWAIVRSWRASPRSWGARRWPGSDP